MVVSSPRNLIGGYGSRSAHVQRVRRVLQQALVYPEVEDRNRMTPPTKNTTKSSVVQDYKNMLYDDIWGKRSTIQCISLTSTLTIGQQEGDA